jgi:hypothetical protein
MENKRFSDVDKLNAMIMFIRGERFPEAFMIRLTELEWKQLITNCDNLGAVKDEPRRAIGFKIRQDEQGTNFIDT